MFSVKKISHVCYDTPKLEAQMEYYAEVMGLTITAKEPDTVYLGSVVDHHSVILHKASHAVCSRLGFQIGVEEDLGDFAAHIEACNLRPMRQSDPAPGVSDQISFFDPKGTLIEVSKPEPVSDLRYKSKGVVPNKLGHVAFHVEDASKMVEFYTNVLGFRVSDWLENFFAFLRCGSDHHTVNFIGSGSVRHDHTAFELRDWAHIQSACEYLRKNNFKIIWGPGRHGIGHNLFTYHKNPDGFITELYAELDTMSNEALGYFDPRPWHPDFPQKPKHWAMKPGLVNLWRDEDPPEEMLKL